MVAYSFKGRFAEPIVAGTKRQTIRAPRRRHARPGEALQLYAAMRTKHCRLIANAKCLDVIDVELDLVAGEVHAGGVIVVNRESGADEFARLDGFADWSDLRAFWAKEHPGVDRFQGVLIRWQIEGTL